MYDLLAVLDVINLQNVNINEELIIVKSLTVHVIMYSILYLLILIIVPINSFQYLFFVTTISVAFFVVSLILVILATFLLTWIFRDIEFYKRSLLTALVNSSAITFVISLFDLGDDKWLAYLFGFMYLLFFELPRFGIITNYEKDRSDPKFIQLTTAHYPKLLIGFFALTVLLYLSSIPKINLKMFGIVLLTNILIVGFLTLIALRLKSKKEIKKLTRVIKAEALALAMVLLFSLSLKLMDNL